MYICMLSFITERLVSVFMSIMVHNLAELLDTTPSSIEKNGPLFLFVKLPVYLSSLEIHPQVSRDFLSSQP